MKQKLHLLLALCLFTVSFAQNKEDAGASFDFNYRFEQNPQIVLADNYNHYLLSVINTDGMTATRQMIVRKFDQKNQLLDTYTYDFPKFDIGTLYNYLGYTETNTGKVVVFTKTYSGRAKKSEIVKHEFDKATAKFTSTAIDSNPILSLGKSGDVSMQKSNNGNYIGIVYTKDREKKQPEKSLVMVLDNNTQNVVWKKDIEIANEHTTKSFTITNSGKVVLLRDNASFKKANNYNYLVVVSPEGEEDKNFEAAIFLQEPVAVSIGAQDYLLAINATTRGKSQADFTHLLFYDLQQGKTLQNHKLSEFSVIKDIKDVVFRDVFLQNNEIHIFAEAKVEAGVKPSAGFSASQFPETNYTYGPAYMYVMSFEGALKSTAKIATLSTQADVSQSFGVLNVKGNYYVNTGFKTGPNSGTHSALYALSAANNYDLSKRILNMSHSSDYTYQLTHYFPDSSKLLTARMVDNNKMVLTTVYDVKL